MRVLHDESPALLVTRLAAGFLLVQGLGVLAWCAVMLLFPDTRSAFLTSGAPDTTLLAYFLPDLALYAGTSFVAAYGLLQGRSWAWPALLVNAGAVAYAGLYGLSLAVLSGSGWPGAALMFPSLVIVPLLAWLLRPGDGA